MEYRFKMSRKDKKNGALMNMIQELSRLLPPVMTAGRGNALNSLDAKMEVIENVVRYVKYLQDHAQQNHKCSSSHPTVKDGDGNFCCDGLKMTSAEVNREAQKGFRWCIMEVNTYLDTITSCENSESVKNVTNKPDHSFTINLVNHLFGRLDALVSETGTKKCLRDVSTSTDDLTIPNGTSPGSHCATPYAPTLLQELLREKESHKKNPCQHEESSNSGGKKPPQVNVIRRGTTSSSPTSLAQVNSTSTATTTGETSPTSRQATLPDPPPLTPAYLLTSNRESSHPAGHMDSSDCSTLSSNSPSRKRPSPEPSPSSSVSSSSGNGSSFRSFKKQFIQRFSDVSEASMESITQKSSINDDKQHSSASSPAGQSASTLPPLQDQSRMNQSDSISRGLTSSPGQAISAPQVSKYPEGQTKLNMSRLVSSKDNSRSHVDIDNHLQEDSKISQSQNDGIPEYPRDQSNSRQPNGSAIHLRSIAPKYVDEEERRRLYLAERGLAAYRVSDPLEMNSQPSKHHHHQQIPAAPIGELLNMTASLPHSMSHQQQNRNVYSNMTITGNSYYHHKFYQIDGCERSQYPHQHFTQLRRPFHLEESSSHLIRREESRNSIPPAQNRSQQQQQPVPTSYHVAYPVQSTPPNVPFPDHHLRHYQTTTSHATIHVQPPSFSPTSSPMTVSRDSHYSRRGSHEKGAGLPIFAQASSCRNHQKHPVYAGDQITNIGDNRKHVPVVQVSPHPYGHPFSRKPTYVEIE